MLLRLLVAFIFSLIILPIIGWCYFRFGYPVGETYWKVANGIRLTGMPAYTNALSETEMWQVSLVLANADKLPQQVRTILEQPLKPD